MKVFAFITVVYTLVSSSIAEVCDNVDTQVCEDLLKQKPDMCSDPCLSKICKRACRMCPLNCFKCDEVDSPEDCTASEICPTSEHYCVATQSFTDTFEEKYKLGCAHRNICSTIFTDSSSKRTVIDGACCQSDLCNAVHPINMTSLPAPQTLSMNATASTVNTNTECSDIDKAVCKNLSIAMPDLCLDSCLASNVCPRTCRVCYECYQCSSASTAEECNTRGVCERGKECYSLETLTADAEIQYRLGCMDPGVCARLQTASIVGKRQTDISLGVHCCKGDGCNHHHKAQTTSTTTTTAKPTTNAQIDCHNLHLQHHQCPQNFTYIHGSCFMEGKTKMTYSDAKLFCETKCSALAEFHSKSIMEDVLQSVARQHPTQIETHSSFLIQREDLSVFVGGQLTNNKWVWHSDGRSIDNSLFETSPSTEHGCLTANYHHLVLQKFQHTRDHEELTAVSCLRNFCKSKCSKLADFDSTSSLTDTAEKLAHINSIHTSFLLHQENLNSYVGAHYANRHWYWDSDNDKIDSSYFEDGTSHNHGDCLTVHYAAYTVNGATHYRAKKGLVPVPCTSLHFPLCKH